MFARGLATRNSLRAFLLASAVLLSSICSAQADDVFLHHDSQTNFGSTGSNTGFYQFHVVAGGTAGWAVGSPVQTFCIDNLHTLIQDGGYNIRNDLHNMPTPGITMGNLNAVRLVILINELYGSGGNVPLIAYETGSASFHNLEIIQDTIWRVLIDHLAPLAGHQTTIINALDSILAASGSLANYISSNSAGFMYAHGLDGQPSDAGQDQVYWNHTNPPYIFDVPVPAGSVLAGVGIVFIGGFNYLRRRKAVAAA